MNLNEFLELNNEESINEGLKYFKNSPKLYKHADNLERKLADAKIKGIPKDQELAIEKLIKYIRKAAKDYENLEQKYANKNVDKTTAKEEYKKLAEKYKLLLKDLNGATLKRALAAIGVSLGVAAAITKLISPFYLMYGRMFLNKNTLNPKTRTVEYYTKNDEE